MRTLLALAALCASGPAAANPVLEAADPDRDDYGPGEYLYPIHPYFFQSGVFDLKGFRIRDGGKSWVFEVEVDRETPRPIEARATLARPLIFEQEVFFQNFDIYIRTPAADLKTAEGEPGRHDRAVPGRNFRFAPGHEWNRAVVITPYPFQVRTLLRDWGPRDDVLVPANVRRIGPRFIVRIPKDAIGNSRPETWRYAVVVSGATPLVQGYVRADDLDPNALTMPIRQNPGRWFFGGGDLSPYNPAIIDLLAPTRARQKELLAPRQAGRRTGPVKLRLASPQELRGASARG